MNTLHRNSIRRRDRAVVATLAGSSLLLMLLLGLCAAGLVALALATPPIADAAERYTLPGNDVAIYNLAGRLTVASSKGSEVEVLVTTAGRDAGSLKVETGAIGSRQTLRVIYPSKHVAYPEIGGMGSSTTVRVHSDGTFGDGSSSIGTSQVKIAHSGDLEAHADLEVRVPAGRNLALHLAAGSVAVNGVASDLAVDVSCGDVLTSGTNGRLGVDTGSGSVRISDANGEVSINTGSGDIDAAGVTGKRVSLETGSGSIHARRAKAEKLVVDTGSGGVELEDLDTPAVHIDTGSGSVRAGFTSSPDDINIDTGSGHVVIRLAERYGAQFEIDTGSGGIDVDLPHTITKRDYGYLRGVIGDGKGHMHVETGSGGVHITRASS